MHVIHVDFCVAKFDLHILACSLLWIQLGSTYETTTTEERPEAALYCSVGLLAVMPSHTENYHHEWTLKIVEFGRCGTWGSQSK